MRGSFGAREPKIFFTGYGNNPGNFILPASHEAKSKLITNISLKAVIVRWQCGSFGHIDRMSAGSGRIICTIASQSGKKF